MSAEMGEMGSKSRSEKSESSRETRRILQGEEPRAKVSEALLSN